MDLKNKLCNNPAEQYFLRVHPVPVCSGSVGRLAGLDGWMVLHFRGSNNNGLGPKPKQNRTKYNKNRQKNDGKGKKNI